MISGSCLLTDKFAFGTAYVLDHLARTIAATGQDIAQTTRELMTPNHFLDTGLSRDETRWEQLSRLSGQVHIPTDYAAYPEFGTVFMAPRSVLTPAVLLHFPASLEKYWNTEVLPGLGPIVQPMEPISRSDRRTGQGYGRGGA